MNYKAKFDDDWGDGSSSDELSEDSGECGEERGIFR